MPSNHMPKGRFKYAKDGQSVIIPESAGLRYIAVICGDNGKFSHIVNNRWPSVEKEYKIWYRSSFGKMSDWKGQIKTVQVQSDTMVILLLSVINDQLDLSALNICLDNLGKEAKYNGASIHITKCSENWKEIENLIDQQLLKRSLNVTVYDN